MRSREQVLWDFVQSWLTKAEHDLAAAETLLRGRTELSDVVGFHCQQTVEKLMKAYLVRYQIEFSKTHNLALLRKLIGQNDQRLADKLAFADWLTPFGVEFRYPGEATEVQRKTVEQALVDARQVHHLVFEALREYLACGRPGS